MQAGIRLHSPKRIIRSIRIVGINPIPNARQELCDTMPSRAAAKSPIRSGILRPCQEKERS
jgi:hypothetical protein